MNNTNQTTADLSDCYFIVTDKEFITLTTETDQDIRCQIVRIFHTPNQDYIVLLPEDGSTDGDGYLLRFAILPDGAPDLQNIDSDEEYQWASDIFHTLNAAVTFEDN